MARVTAARPKATKRCLHRGLPGLDAAYIKRQHRNFRNGLRGAQPQDRYGRQMALMATTLASERELDDVIGYIHAAEAAR